MNKKKIYRMISIALFILLIVLIIALAIKFNTIDFDLSPLNDVPVEIIQTAVYPESTSEVKTSVDSDEISTPTPSPTTTETPKPTATPDEIANSGQYAWAAITINTDKKVRTYEIMDDVNESTLRKNIGHLPSSAMPGEVGSCILMGHRDTDFSILQYVKLGDKLTVKVQDTTYTYTVSDIQIIDSDDDLKFNAANNSNLVLVTCYPFKYSGHAPQKCVVYAKLGKLLHQLF